MLVIILVCQVVILTCAAQSVPSAPDVACPGCTEQTGSAPPSSISAEEIRREMLRWEKEKILKQLGRPVENEEEITTTSTPHRRMVRRVRSITKSEIDEVLKMNGSQEGAEEDEDMETAILLGKQVRRGSTTTVQCYDEASGRMGTCIDFINKTDIKWDRFKFATLRFRLDPDNSSSDKRVNHTFSVKAINFGKPESSPGHSPSNITVTIIDPNQYIEMDVTHQILRRALAFSHAASLAEREAIQSIMTLRVTCLTCRNAARSPVSLDLTRLPFLEIGFIGRKKRASPTCEMLNDYLVKEPSKRGCCMVPVDVQFNEIGMEYILHPPRYRTHYCSGRCNRITTRSYSAIIQNVIAMRLHKLGYDDQISLCCIPMSTNKLPIVYQNESGAVDVSNLTDMLVTSCGC